jgi:3-hydroxyacyl-CoA dehydrogenase
VAAAVAAAEQLGKQPIVATDVPGFLVNRCGRPFYGEALRIVTERLATPAQVDRICRMAGGFRMGPFELMDLVGVDTGLDVSRSFYEQSFGEPRWRPSPIQQRMVASGRLGRKTGRGFYLYEDETPHRPRDPDVETERPIFDDDELERIAGPSAPAILTRLGATIANEACFALGERVASDEDINTAMRLGYNWPIGSLEWGERLGSSGARPTAPRPPCASSPPERPRAPRGRVPSRSRRSPGRRSRSSFRRAPR